MPLPACWRIHATMLSEMTRRLTKSSGFQFIGVDEKANACEAKRQENSRILNSEKTGSIAMTTCLDGDATMGVLDFGVGMTCRTLGTAFECDPPTSEEGY